MKTVVLKKIVQALTLASAAAFGSSAFAGATWLFGDNNPTNECNATEAAGGCAAQAGSTAGSPGVKVSAYSTTGTSGTFAAATLTSWDGGLGVQANGSVSDSGTPQHAIDNNGYTDMILLNFGSAKIDLDSIKIGWNNNGDADISVFRYVGTSASPTPAGLSVTNMSSGGWELVGNYADLSTSGARGVNSTNTSSSWWLISAYSEGFGSSKETAGGTLGSGNDYFKVLSVAGNVVAPPPPSKIPEPGSLALMGVAMAGFVATRRRKSKAI
ncbi:exosortase-dependent surface protein XDP1 [Rhodoferax sp. U11-2br]|uniref:exosortase-dependent surface protein XDP1 n=1 Tax=Rhodoferax sp. U11-2br TaxID=2838878 RepID=UPI001BE6F2B6|nr:exosortase-dependent surface protein XDP1 [Rhodoferax sp. U11-2br]MBT3067058.1 PEP-CTERM sorting domain-containing protein [Rhodoferax sp. U11-2br]